MKSSSAFVFAAALLAVPAVPQTPAQPAQAAQPGRVAQPTQAAAAAPKAGATVYDTAGGTVGTIESVNAQGAVLSTGTVKVTLPLTSFGAGAKGPVIAVTRAELETQAQAAQAQAAGALDAKLVAGATVAGANGASVGTVKAVEGEFVTVTTAKGDVRLPKAAFGPGDTGVRIGMTAQEFDAAVAGATTAAGTAPAEAAPATAASGE